MRFDRRLLGWGAFFVLLGGIPLAVRWGYLDAELLGRWASLWPLLPIGWGLSLLLRRTPIDWLGGAVSTLTLGVMGGSLIATGWSGIPFDAGVCGDRAGQPFAAQTGSFGDRGSLDVELGCGELTIRSIDGSGWRIEGSSEAGRAPEVARNGDAITIRGPQDEHFFAFDRATTSWTVSLPRAPTLDLAITHSAGEASASLAGAHVGRISLTLNAGSLRLDAGAAAALGSIGATVNAGSAIVLLPSFGGAADFTVNAGSLELCIPTGAAARVRAQAVVGSHNLDAVGFLKVGDETWQSAGYDSAATRIDIDVTANAGSFSLEMGGGCGA